MQNVKEKEKEKETFALTPNDHQSTFPPVNCPLSSLLPGQNVAKLGKHGI